MLPSELKLTSLGHCYVHLPETFVSKKYPAIKGGAIVSLKSLQTENELFVMWNGQLTSGEHVQLDFNFGQANKFKDELVIISLTDEEVNPIECSMCRVELINSADYQILSQHSETNLLDTFRLVYRDLVVPVYVSQHVHVLVKVIGFEPAQLFGLLTKWTDMSFEHNLDDTTNNTTTSNINSLNGKATIEGDASVSGVQNPIAFLSYSLGNHCNSNKNNKRRCRLRLASMLICGERGSGKTYLLKSILNDYSNNGGVRHEYINCKQLRGKRPESISKIFSELLHKAHEEQSNGTGLIIALDDIDSLLDSDPKRDNEHGPEVLYKKRLVDLFCCLLEDLANIERLYQLEAQPQPLKEATTDSDVKEPLTTTTTTRTTTTTSAIVSIATCRSLDVLDKRIAKPQGRRYFNEIIQINPPNASDRLKIIKNIINEQKVRSSLSDEQLQEIAQKCASFMPTDLKLLFERALINACSRTSLEFNSDPMTLQMEDFEKSLDNYVPINLRGMSLQPKTKRTFHQVGGMFKIKETLTRIVLLPLKYPNLYKKAPFKAQNSILLYGPPGCGKTLIAEALANQEGLNSICVRGPELLSKYIGGSEAAVRDLFKRAQLARPCVIFFDEFESLVAKRGSDSTGVTDRVVNQFLTILDGVESLAQDVFILAASSRPDMIDPAMLRPGRLDRHLYCGLPDHEDRREILKVLSKNIEFTKQLDVVAWSAKLDGFTGADIQAFLYSAQLKALHALVDTVPSATLEPSSTSSLRQTTSRDAFTRIDGGLQAAATTTTTTSSSTTSTAEAESRTRAIPSSSSSSSSSTTAARSTAKAHLQIKVSQKHLIESFKEMKRDVDLRLKDLLIKYPSSINQLKQQQQVSMRATLA